MASEDGMRSWPVLLATVLVAGLLGAAAYVLLGFAAGDSDRYGRVPVPGVEELRLEEGEADLFIAWSRQEPNPSFPVEVSIRDPAGRALEIRSRGGQSISGPSGSASLVGSVEVPADGIYAVGVRSADAPSGASPELTLGSSPFDAAGDRLAEVSEIALGPLGLAVLALVGGTIAVGVVRRRSELPGPEPPSGYEG